MDEQRERPEKRNLALSQKKQKRQIKAMRMTRSRTTNATRLTMDDELLQRFQSGHTERLDRGAGRSARLPFYKKEE